MKKIRAKIQTLFISQSVNRYFWGYNQIKIFICIFAKKNY